MAMFKATRGGVVAKNLVSEDDLYEFFDMCGLDEGVQAAAVCGVPIVLDGVTMTFEQVQ